MRDLYKTTCGISRINIEIYFTHSKVLVSTFEVHLKLPVAMDTKCEKEKWDTCLQCPCCFTRVSIRLCAPSRLSAKAMAAVCPPLGEIISICETSQRSAPPSSPSAATAAAAACSVWATLFIQTQYGMIISPSDFPQLHPRAPVSSPSIPASTLHSTWSPLLRSSVLHSLAWKRLQPCSFVSRW